MQILIYIYDDSDYSVISLWYPKWACGNFPDMLVIGSMNNQFSKYIGKIYIYVLMDNFRIKNIVIIVSMAIMSINYIALDASKKV